MLSGDDEARLAFRGATSTLAAPPPGTIAVVDVGGMSTEIAVGTLAGGVTWSHSFAIGSSALAGRCHGDPPSPEDLATMRAAARDAFAGAPIPAADDAVAVGGSAASLPTLVGPVLDARRAGARARRPDAAPPPPRSRAATASRPSAPSSCPRAYWCSTRPPSAWAGRCRIGRGGLREGVVLELANAR